MVSIKFARWVISLYSQRDVHSVLFAIFLLLLFSVPYVVAWSTPVKVDPSMEDESYPDIAVDSSGIYITYGGNASGNYDVWFSKSTDGGTTWATPVKIHPPSTAIEWYPDIAVDPGGIYITYYGNVSGNWDVWFSKSTDGGTTWAAPVKIDPSVKDEGAPAIVVDSGVYITYYGIASGNRDVWFSKSTDGGTTWATPVKVDPSTEDEEAPAIACDSNGIYVTYRKNTSGNSDILFSKSTDGGATWSAPVKIHPPTVGHEHLHAIACDTNGIYVTYEKREYGRWDVWFCKSTDGGATWSIPVKVHPPSIFCECGPDIAVDPGSIYIAYRGKTTGNFDIWFTKSTDGGATWSVPIKVDPSTAYEHGAAIAVDSNGIYITYRGKASGNWDVWFSKESQTIDIYTDKYYYYQGDTLHLGLDVSNPVGSLYCNVVIYLKDPSGGDHYLFSKYLTLPPGLEYSNPSFKQFTVPKIPQGTYTWVTQILDPSTGDIIAEDQSLWEFVATVKDPQAHHELLLTSSIISLKA